MSATSGSAGQFVVDDEPVTQCTADHGEQHVVEPDAALAPDLTQLIDRQRHPCDATVRAHRAVERHSRDGPVVACLLDRVHGRTGRRERQPCDFTDDRDAAARVEHVAGGADRAADGRPRRLDQQVGVGRHHVGPPGPAGGCVEIRLGTGQHRRERSHRAELFDQHDVHLDEEVAAAVGVLDQVELPERAVPVERAFVQSREQLFQCVGIRGTRHGQVADVVVEVELRVFDPPRVVEAERHVAYPPTERRGAVQGRLDHGAETIEREMVAVGVGSELEAQRLVPQVRVRLRGEQCVFRRCQLMHRRAPVRGTDTTSAAAGGG